MKIKVNNLQKGNDFLIIVLTLKTFISLFFQITKKVLFLTLQKFTQIHLWYYVKLIPTKFYIFRLILYSSMPIQELQNHMPLLCMSLLVFYAIYYYIFRYLSIRMKGHYDISKKKLGRTLPPYPNGWYIACKSKDLASGEVKSIEISGQNLVLFRTSKGEAMALHAYCPHMGANLGEGGKVVNDSCIQCPFHGWLFEGKTGQCVDHDGKPITTNVLEYDENLGSKQSKEVEWIEGRQSPKQCKFITRQINTFIYVWIHSDPTVQPYFTMLNNQQWISKYQNRGQTIHDIMCHMQDIPQNGADVFHFKYIHKYLIDKYKMFPMSWAPIWKKGDDPTLSEIFEHKYKDIRAYKQQIYTKLIKPIENKQFYSLASVDSYLRLPIIGQVFAFNITIIQMGPGTVNIFLKSRFFQTLFMQYIQSQGKFHQRLYHQMFCSKWMPYWLSGITLLAEGMQVFYDMLVWDAKRFSYKLCYKQNQADNFIKNWRSWFSQHYQGCDVQLQANVND